MDLQTIVKDLQEKGASLKTTEQTIDTSTPVRKRFLDMLSALSEFVTFLHKERPAEGIAKGKKKAEKRQAERDRDWSRQKNRLLKGG